MDVMRSPALGDASDLRQWDVADHAMPLPFNIGSSQFNDLDLWTSSSSLTEAFFAPRKYQAFRAVERDDFFLILADCTNSARPVHSVELEVTNRTTILRLTSIQCNASEASGGGA
jgi:hypothetical protein